MEKAKPTGGSTNQRANQNAAEKPAGKPAGQNRNRPVNVVTAPQTSAVRAVAPTPAAPAPAAAPKPAHVKIHNPNVAPGQQGSPAIPPGQQKVGRDDVHRIISRRLGNWRPNAWEDDISFNTLDRRPFHNVVPPSQLAKDKFNSPRMMEYINTQLNGQTIEELIAKDTCPIPSEKDREGYSVGFDGIYWLSGLTDFMKIMEVARRYNVNPTSYFDFGCATGRVLRHFASQLDLEKVWGSDINGRHVRWLYEHMPENVRPIFNHCIPTIPIPDNSVDIISAFSVFTHIDTFETCWLAELSRIMKDDGLCYLTVHNEDTWGALQKEVGNENNRLLKSIFKCDPELETKIFEPLPDTKTVYRFSDLGPYRAQVFHSNNYLKKVWGRFFKIEEILGCHHVRQTVLVLRKK